MNWVRPNTDIPHSDPQSSMGHSWKKESPLEDRPNTRPLFQPLKESFAYWTNDLKEIALKPSVFSDLTAGVTVAAVALPLNLALAVASGLPASTGIISGAIGGFLAAFLGGSRWQVTGPAAALNVMVFAIVAKFGAAGAAAAALFTGITCLLISFFGLGKWMSKVPEAVVAGFTTGVGLKLLDQQLPHLFGVQLEVSSMLSDLHNPTWLQQVSWNEVLCGLTVIFFVLALKALPRLPGALIGLTIATFIANYLNWDLKKVGELQATLPEFLFPDLSQDAWISVFLLSIPLSLLGAVESLLSARVIDRLESKAKPHHSNLELLGQGIANIAVGFFSGMPVTGVVVRSTVNIQSGGKTRISAMAHGLLLIIALLYFSEYLAKIPIAALAGLLCLIGFRLVETHHFFHLLKTNRLEAIGFTIAAIGTLSNALFFGLISGIALILLGQLISRRLRKSEEFAAEEVLVDGLRAVIKKPIEKKGLIPHRQPLHVQFYTPPALDQWMMNVDENPWLHPSAYVHPKATLIGRVVVERAVHIAAETSIRADEGTPFFVGNRTNLQDGVVLHALKDRHVEVQGQKWAIYIDEQVSVAHQALIHGPCFVGARSFVGFKAVVHDSVVGPDCFIGIGSVVVGVEVPPGRYVPHGTIIDTQDKANSLPEATQAHHHFNEDVVEVNEGLASAYQWLDQKEKLAWKQSSWAPQPAPLSVSHF
jgi:sulfate permease, SulP family